MPLFLRAGVRTSIVYDRRKHFVIAKIKLNPPTQVIHPRAINQREDCACKLATRATRNFTWIISALHPVIDRSVIRTKQNKNDQRTNFSRIALAFAKFVSFLHYNREHAEHEVYRERRNCIVVINSSRYNRYIGKRSISFNNPNNRRRESTKSDDIFISERTYARYLWHRSLHRLLKNPQIVMKKRIYIIYSCVPRARLVFSQLYRDF